MTRQFVPEVLSADTEILFQQAAAYSLTPIEFACALEAVGITGSEKVLYIADAFGLPLEEAKKTWIIADYGSVDAWAEEMCEVVDELSSTLAKVGRKEND